MKPPKVKPFKTTSHTTSVVSENIIAAYHIIMMYVIMSQGVKKNVITFNVNYKNSGKCIICFGSILVIKEI